MIAAAPIAPFVSMASGATAVGVSIVAQSDSAIPTTWGQYGVVGGFAAAVAGVVLWIDRRDGQRDTKHTAKEAELEEQLTAARERAHQVELNTRDSRIDELERSADRDASTIDELRNELARRPPAVVQTITHPPTEEVTE